MLLIVVLVCLVHIAACVLWFLFGKLNKAEALVMLPLVVCLPVFGILIGIISVRQAGEAQETPLEKMYQQVERDIASVNTGRPELDAVVPFDEVLMMSNDHARREVMMHILRRDPFAYLEMLKTAKSSSDVEITHYATTTIMEIQRDLDIAMQKAEADYTANPDDLDTVNRFISALSSYIGTGLLLENRMIQLQNQLSDVLEHKLLIFPNSRSAHLQLIENNIHLGNYERAAAVAAEMCEKWPFDEESWLNSLHVCMASGNITEKTRIAMQIQILPINWSKAGREEADFLCGQEKTATEVV